MFLLLLCHKNKEILQFFANVDGSSGCLSERPISISQVFSFFSMLTKCVLDVQFADERFGVIQGLLPIIFYFGVLRKYVRRMDFESIMLSEISQSLRKKQILHIIYLWMMENQQTNIHLKPTVISYKRDQCQVSPGFYPWHLMFPLTPLGMFSEHRVKNKP